MQIVIFLTSTVLLLGGAKLLSYVDLNGDLESTSISQNDAASILMLSEVKDVEPNVSPFLSNGHIGFYVFNETPIFTASEFYTPSSYNLGVIKSTPYSLTNFYQAKDYFGVDSAKTPQKVVIHKKIDLSGV